MFKFRESPKPLIWSYTLLLALGLEAGALVFQYLLDYGPCALCVQIRATLFGALLLAVAGKIFSARAIQTLIAMLLVPLMAFLLYQSYQVLGIERYWFESSCTLSDPFPSWLPLHLWLPAIFEPWELCGYTPEIIKGITMAEVLIVTAAVSLALSIWHLITQLKSH